MQIPEPKRRTADVSLSRVHRDRGEGGGGGDNQNLCLCSQLWCSWMDLYRARASKIQRTMVLGLLVRHHSCRVPLLGRDAGARDVAPILTFLETIGKIPVRVRLVPPALPSTPSLLTTTTNIPTTYLAAASRERTGTVRPFQWRLFLYGAHVGTV